MATKKKAAKKSAGKAAAGSPFDALTPDDVQKIVDDSVAAEVKVSAKFMAGDHWQNAAGWVGPIPELSDPDYGVTSELIEAAFTSRNVIKEIVSRHMRGVVGDEPTYGIAPRVPLPAGQQLEDAKLQEKRDIEATITEWMDSRLAHLAIQKATSDALWSDRGVLRLYVPRGKVINGVVPPQPDLRSALSLVYLDATDPLSSMVNVDDDTKDQLGILLTELNGKLRVELSYLAPSTSAIENDPKNPRLTILRTIDEENGDQQFEVSIGGRITMYQITRDKIITQQQQQMQRALNLALSMNPRTVVTGGFLERIILNALPPGHWQTDDRGRRVRFIRETWQTGPGTTQWVRGIELPQKDGSVQLTDPTVSMRPPVDTASADNAKRSLYRDMLEEADQAHVLVTGETLPSGKSKIEGRSDFSVSLTQTEAPVNGAGRWLIETLLALGEFFQNKEGSILTDWRGQFECTVNAGPVSIEERQQAIAELDAFLISEETAMGRIGVLDTQAERDRILAEYGGIDMRRMKKRGEVFALYVTAGAVIEEVAVLLGFKPDEAKKLGAGSGDAVPPTGLDPNGLPIPADNPPLNDPSNPPSNPPAPQGGGN